MINKTKKEVEIECLDKLLFHYGYYADLVNYLMDNKLMLHSEDDAIRKEGASINKYLYEFLKKLQQEEKLQLLDFEWQMLPDERIKLTLVASMSSKVIQHNF